MRASARGHRLLILTIGALLASPLATASSAVGRGSTAVWVIARVERKHCDATLRVSAGHRAVALTVRGTRPRRYVTAVLASAGEPISTAQKPNARCRALVLAKGMLADSHRQAREPSTAPPSRIVPSESAIPGQPASPVSPLTATVPTIEPAAESPGVVLGTFNVVGASQMQAWAAAGGTAVVVPVIWADAQPSQGGAVTLQAAGNEGQSVLAEIAEARAAHLQVYLELDLQYPPDWVKQSVPQFVNQAGTPFSSTIPGKDIRDWVWSEAGREAVAAFAAGALSDLQPELGEIAGIRVGGGIYGEMQYPDDGSMVEGQPSYWGYDAAAQSGTGLAAGEQATPLPGYVYGHGTTSENAEWASWYLQSLGNFVHWYILQLRQDGWQGPVYVLEPSYGMRENWSPRSPEYELQLALGTDYAVQMDAYDTLPNAWPWSTWADDAEPFYYPGDPVDSDQAAWRKLLEVAQERGLASHIMGENTGGGGATAIDQLMSGALRAGYRGIFYLDYPALTANGGTLLNALVSTFDEQLSLAAT